MQDKLIKLCGLYENTSKAMAKWFAELWRQFGYTTGVHLRRVHYQVISQDIARKHNGK
jgi:hypothetical protein